MINFRLIMKYFLKWRVRFDIYFSQISFYIYITYTNLH